MSIETRIRRLVKKKRVKKSRWTVPLRMTTGQATQPQNSCPRHLGSVVYSNY
jgi:hypothetical protein